MATNRLIHETSPYLLQHAHNPVDWYPWGGEALEKAVREDKPILLSIGYSSCHWCHVMERESFEDPEIGKLMSDRFVCIKVDREERPDLDEIYMAATTTLNRGQGGWPMTVFLTPEKQPFYAGTYFPPRDMHGRPGFRSVLERISELWQQEREGLTRQAADLTDHLQRQSALDPGLTLGGEQIEQAVTELTSRFDTEHGGFGKEPKFPPSTTLELLLRHHRRTGDPAALHMVKKTLDHMARGGMYDQIGGGFARYSTDARWLVPHFEKMLYDNALLAHVYVEAWQVTKEPFYRHVATDVLDYVLRDMTSPEGGFYSATDADSEGEEGKFFVWSKEEVIQILGEEEGKRVCRYFDVTQVGNWEGKNVPWVPRPIEAVAAELGITPLELARSVDAGRRKLHEAREKRVHPSLDDKVITSWNALMIRAMAEAYRAFGDARFLEGAENAADFLLEVMRPEDGRLRRTYRKGRAHLDAYLEDYASLCEALVDLHEASGEPRWIFEARMLAHQMVDGFGDEEAGAFFSTSKDHEQLLFRHREGNDGAVPSSNAMAAAALIRLSRHLGRPDLKERAIKALQAFGKTIERFPGAFAKSLIAVDTLLEPPLEIALVGSFADPGTEALRRALGEQFLPNRILALHDSDRVERPDFALLEGKDLVNGKAALYLCRDFTCQAPVTDPAAVAGEIDRARGSLPRVTTIGTRLAGRATPDGTRRYHERRSSPSTATAALGRTGLTVSRLGFGGYRVDVDLARHAEALEYALSKGVNLLDTSTNYADGGSEKLFGKVLSGQIGKGALSREEVVVVSKIGYVQGSNLELAQKREAAGAAVPEMVKYMDGCWHCIHPSWLEDQLQRSLDRLRLDTIDVCLLHNPEYFFTDAARRGRTDLGPLREEFQRRLVSAFQFMESAVASGRIAWYGVSSNSSVSLPSDPEATSLSRMLEAAHAAGGEDHHFRVLQLPFNLFEAGAHRIRNTGPGESRTVLEEATASSVAVLANRPLNAFHEGRMMRLADFHPPDAEFDLMDQLNKVRVIEEEFRRDMAPMIRVPPGAPKPDEFFRNADFLVGAIGEIQDFEHWKQVEAHHVWPQLQAVLQSLDAGLQGPESRRWFEWRQKYLVELQRLLKEFARLATEKSAELSSRVSDALDESLPGERHDASLSQKSVWVLASTPGVTSVLVGMRDPEYVDDVTEILSWPPLTEVTPVYESLVTASFPAE